MVPFCPSPLERNRFPCVVIVRWSSCCLSTWSLILPRRFLSSNSAYFACLLLSLLLFVAFQITLIGNLDGAWDLSAMSVAIPLYASNAALLLAMAIAFGKDYYYSNRSIPLCC